MKPRLRGRIALACGALILPCMHTMAQHAADNPVTAADDAFGLTLGLESIGMYSPGQVRGFSPRTAGNLRIEGLYFDQQGSLSNRVIEVGATGANDHHGTHEEYVLAKVQARKAEVGAKSAGR